MSGTPRKLLQLPEILPDKVNMSKASFYRKIKEGVFPPPYKLGGRSSYWDAGEIDAAIEKLIAEQQQQRGEAA